MIKRNYLISHRKRWALTQSELAGLLNVSRSTVSAYERIDCLPAFTTLLRMEIVFGTTPSRLFPSLLAREEDRVMRRAAKMHRVLHGRTDRDSQRKLALLDDMMKRATDQQLAV